MTIDTEPDNQWDLSLRKDPTFRNIAELTKLQRLFDKFYAKPTYLTSFSVVKSGAVAVLKDIAKSVNCEIGTHLHAWETPPFKRHIKGNGTYLHQYAFDAQSQKLANLDNLISETFGCKPVSYRGGRWSFDKNILSILSEYKYLVDSSVSPGISWENDGGIDFKKWASRDCFLEAKDAQGILEIPPTIEIRAKMPLTSKFLYLNTPNWTHMEGMLRRLVNFNIIWLDPSFNKFKDMKWVCDKLLAENVNYLNIMFHSCVIILGGSPYTMSGENVKNFFERLEKLLDYLLRVKKLETLTLREFYSYSKDNFTKEQAL
ncbi:MAG: hypothetical protein KKD11_04645 [Candidatus Omnitrophica bacterium]|nr:hypothetical protein [Candidatus Omnitrophota bacterium]